MGAAAKSYFWDPALQRKYKNDIATAPSTIKITVDARLLKNAVATPPGRSSSGAASFPNSPPSAVGSPRRPRRPRAASSARAGRFLARREERVKLFAELVGALEDEAILFMRDELM